MAIPNLRVFVHPSLAGYTRFDIGGPARAVLDASDEKALIEVSKAIRDSGWPSAVIGGGSNLVVSDSGFDGAILRYTGSAIDFDGETVRVRAGAVLQNLVDATIARGLRGLETMTGIPGWVGGAIYGNAGAYGHSIQERIESVSFFDGTEVREIGRASCEFRYRESVFKKRRDWIVISAVLRLDPADASELRQTASGILKIRNAKYPPEMRCAGSIFKNLLFDELPEPARAHVPANVVREGKVPSAFFLEKAGAKGMSRGAIRVADYHANLIYNTGGGSAHDLRSLIRSLKSQVRERFGVELQEEVQYIA